MTLTRRGHWGPAGFCCALLMVVTLWPVAADASRWVATEITPVGTTQSGASAVSDTGQVVGMQHDCQWTDPCLFLDAATAGSSTLGRSGDQLPGRRA